MNNRNHAHELNATHPGSFLAGMVFGGLVGAGAMLLLAPQSGQQTRAQIKRTGRELQTQALEAVDEGMDQTHAKVQQLTDDLRSKAKEIQQSGKDMLTEAKVRTSAVVTGVKSALPAVKA